MARFCRSKVYEVSFANVRYQLNSDAGVYYVTVSDSEGCEVVNVDPGVVALLVDMHRQMSRDHMDFQEQIRNAKEPKAGEPK